MIKIRKGKKSDSGSIVDFQIRMAKETEQIDLEREIVKKGVDAVFKDPTKGIYFIAESDNRVIASLMITFEWSDWRNGNVYWIQSVYVLPEFRKHGVFKSIYQHVKDIVKNDKNVTGLRLYVDKTNVNARKVYEALGMDDEHYQLFEWMK